MSLPAIEISGLGKRYQLNHSAAPELLRDRIAAFFRPSRNGSAAKEEFWALRDVSLAIPRGEVLGIIGRNGAGKSTFLKVISRITEPTTGQVRIRGRVASLLEVGTGFHPELTGRENVFLNGAILGMKWAEIRRKFDEIVAFAEVERFLDTPVKHYSSGMYVRLAFAVAAHLEPEILIVDEVLAVGDAAFQKKCLGKMRDVAAGGERTVIFVSHNMGAVRGLCSRVAWLEGGRLRATGEPGALLNDYLREAEGNLALAVPLDARPELAAKQLHLTRVVINGGRPVLHGEPLVVEFEYVARTAIEGVSFGIGFSNLEGTRLMTIDSDLDGRRPNLPAGSRGRVRLELPALHLQPTVYLVDVGARSGDYFGLDYAPSCARLEVLPGATTPASIIRPDGGVREPAQWSGFPE